MKVDRLEAHDRLLHLKQDQALNIAQGAEDCLKKNKLSLALQRFSPYIYIFAHPRTLGFDEKMSMWASGVFKCYKEVPEKVMFWQARLTKPKAQTNSYLFRAISNTDNLEVCWLLPPREMWAQYKTGNVTENELVNWSTTMFTEKRQDLEREDPNDMTDEQSKNIYRIIAREMDEEKRMKKMFATLETSEDASFSQV
jgi:hypothetical protein